MLAGRHFGLCDRSADDQDNSGGQYKTDCSEAHAKCPWHAFDGLCDRGYRHGGRGHPLRTSNSQAHLPASGLHDPKRTGKELWVLFGGFQPVGYRRKSGGAPGQWNRYGLHASHPGILGAHFEFGNSRNYERRPDGYEQLVRTRLAVKVNVRISEMRERSQGQQKQNGEAPQHGYRFTLAIQLPRMVPKRNVMVARAIAMARPNANCCGVSVT